MPILDMPIEDLNFIGSALQLQTNRVLSAMNAQLSPAGQEALALRLSGAQTNPNAVAADLGEVRAAEVTSGENVTKLKAKK
jgi:hypothetical protein